MIRTATIAIVALSAAWMCSRAVAAPAEVRFNRDVRPIISENCIGCHGRDDAKRKGDFRLDLPDGATHAAKDGKIPIVPGKIDQSELVRKITATSPDDRMPPADSNKHLTADQIETLKQWIAQGAKYEEHWAFVAPVRPQLPMVKDQSWCKNPIDCFVLARLESENMKPSPRASRATLLRRVYLDLVGLPPTVEQLNAFLNDDSPNAYEKVVEQLLASPHYGERWGRHWLDAARYADSDGYEKDKLRFIWFYRDYVIDAFNRDLPYNQFIIEQLAGDQLPHPTQAQRVATGFLRNSMLNEEGGVDPEQFRMDEMFDRMDCIGKSILGLTIQCAQCHNHKFDPISQEEYYRLFAFLNNDWESQRVVYAPDQLMKISNLRRQMRQIELDLQTQTPDWRERMSAWEEQIANNQPKWGIVKLEHIGDNDQRYLPQKDGSYLAQGYAPTKFTATFKARTNLEKVTAIRLEYLTDPNLPAGGPGRSIFGTCALSEFSADAASTAEPRKTTKVKFSQATSDYDQPARDLESIFGDRTNNHRTTGPVKNAIDGNANTAWGIDSGPGRRNVHRKAVFDCAKPIEEKDGIVLTIHLSQNHGGWNSDDNQNNNLGRFRISVTDADGPVAADPVPQEVRDILAIPKEQRSPAQVETVFNYWRTTVPQWAEENKKIDSLWKQWPEGTLTSTLTARKTERDTHILSRGDWLKPTKEVTPGVPAILNPLPKDAPPTRMTFAKWLVDDKAPTTARAYVNRMWQHYFGIGIVSTSEDFGTQGEMPSHPELLDWLACEFMHPSQRVGSESALVPWSMKHIHRLIVLSATYQQSSRITPQEYTADPYDRMLERGARFRVDGEIVRDIALSASGLLDPEVGGRSIMPPAPAFLFQPPASYAPFPWIEDNGPEKYRRSVYIFRRRSTPYPMLQTFDVPKSDVSCVRRQRSNSPLQALVTLNDPMFVECAQAMAKKVLKEGGSNDADRIDYVVRSVVSRSPTKAERDELLSLLNKERKRFAEGWLNPNELAAGQATPPKDLPSGATPTDLAAYTALSRVVLNLDEAITKE